MAIGTLSYAAAAAAYCFLTVLLLIGWRGRLAGALLTLAALLTAAWTAVMAYQAERPEVWKLPGELLEIAHKTGWLVFLLILLGYARRTEEGADLGLRRIAVGILVACAAIMALSVALRIPADSAWLRELRFLTSILAPGLLALIGMLLV